uniref:Alpha-mannosidase n=1 Tax=Panagrellus redivivus TaxID=6233 RepID=A0A7E4WCA8_PANRE
LQLQTGVQYIIDTVVEGLKRDKNRRFVYAEVSFLTRWLDTRSDEEVQDIIDLVKNGQLEFVGGGWVQPDEGATHYVDIIDQYTLGLRKLNSTFGSQCGHPKIGWQLDPFGHSREHGNILAELGYEGMVFGREHHLEQDARLPYKGLEMNWYTSNENPDRKILTKSLNNLYFMPGGMCWDVFCDNQPVVANPKFENFNAESQAQNVVNHVEKDLQPYQRHNHYVFMMGSDFLYQGAEQYMRNIDNLIKVVRQKTKYNIFYSTPSCYFKAIKEANQNWPNKTYDFMPYASSVDEYWTGYFTSKPALKGLVRQSSALLNTIRQQTVFAQPKTLDEYNSPELKLEKACGLAQHHDGITGTSKEHVTKDYEKRLLNGWTSGYTALQNALQGISQAVKKNSETFPTQVVCRLLNESVCDFTKTNQADFAVTIVNGNSQATKKLIRFPVWHSMLALVDANDKEIEQAWLLPSFTNAAQLPTADVAPYELQFIYEVPANGFTTVFVSSLKKYKQLKLHQEAPRLDSKAEVTVESDTIRITFDSNNLIVSVTDLTTNTVYPLRQHFMYYEGHDNNGPASGAYIFRPQTQQATEVNSHPYLSTVYLEGRQQFSDWVSQTIRLTPGKKYVEFEWTVGPLPENDHDGKRYGKELISRYETGIGSKDIFYTDSNGRQLIQRKRNYNPDFQVDTNQVVSMNMLPVNSRALIKDEKTAFTVLTDRSHAGGSIVDGALDFLLHRRDFYDDGKGVDENLDEPGRDGKGLVVRGVHRIYFGDADKIAAAHRPGAVDFFYQPVITFSTYDSITSYTSKYAANFTGAATALPANVQILTLKQLAPGKVLLRLEHFFAKDEDATLSKPATVDLKNFFADKCAWDSCPAYTNDGSVNVHLIAHTHDDAGWIKTVDDYFTGYNARQLQTGVQYIIDTVVEGLKRDKNRRFVYAEVSFLTRWLDTRSDEEVQDIIDLVKNGQL